MKPTATTCAPPSAAEMATALQTLRDVLGRDYCYLHHGRFHFKLSGDWSLALSADSAGRFRVETCYLAVPRGSLWAFAPDHGRLVAVAREASCKASALV